MYYDYDEFENYYERTPADEILTEAMEKFKDVLKAEVKDNLKYIQEENKRLKQENEELMRKARELDSREKNLKIKEEDLSRNFEYKFYQKKFSEILKPFEEQLDMWYVEPVSELIPKCDQCDEDRKVNYVSGTGKIIKGDCECKKYHRVCKIRNSKPRFLNLFKSDRQERKFILTPKYDSPDYDETYCKVNIQNLIQNFDVEKAASYKYYGGYGSFDGFTSKSECEKYCNWLNEKAGAKVEENGEFDD